MVPPPLADCFAHREKDKEEAAMRGSTQLDGLWRVIVTRPLGVGCLLLLGLGASLTWAAVPLEAEQPRRAEVLVGRRLGRTPPIREYLATHSQPPNSEAHIIPSAQRYFRPGAPSRAGGNGSAPGSFVTDPMLSADSTSSTNFIDPVLQSSQGTTSVSAPLVSFDGINNTVAPPDANSPWGPTRSLRSSITSSRSSTRQAAGSFPMDQRHLRLFSGPLWGATW